MALGHIKEVVTSLVEIISDHVFPVNTVAFVFNVSNDIMDIPGSRKNIEKKSITVKISQ